MPAGLAPVTGTRPAVHRPRHVAKAVVGALLALVGVLAPVETSSLPDPLDDVAGTERAEAQSVRSGTPDACVAPWVEADALCVWEQPACPEHPLWPAHPTLVDEYLKPSTDYPYDPAIPTYPDFCEARVDDSSSHAVYTDCTNLRGHVIRLSIGGTRECRLIAPARCAQQLHRVASNNCRRVQRRQWTCTTGIPTNKWNTCYVAPAGYSGSNPACLGDAPAFVLLECEDYVGQDFARDPTATSSQCASFDTGSRPSLLRQHTNDYWCKFDPSYLDVDCYASGACGTSSDSLCLKRASATGGCDAIANTLRCRSLQAGYRDKSISADEAYARGCTPCQVLPFVEVPRHCPTALTSDPRPAKETQYDRVHQRKRDTAGTGSTTCVDPARGRLVWHVNHHAGSAVIGSPVLLNVVDIPNTTVDRKRYRFIAGAVVASKGERFFQYPEPLSDPFIRVWPTIDRTKQYGDVSEMIKSKRGGECRIHDWPDFRIMVQELWPDSDLQAIIDLFGSHSVEWWTDLMPDERRRMTEARGLKLIEPTMSIAERDKQLDHRSTALTEELRCNHGRRNGDVVWCRWLPERSGYYRLVAAGAWWMKTYGTGRNWRPSFQWRLIDDFLKKVDPKDSSCPSRYDKWRRARDYDCILADLAAMGYATPAEAGMNADNYHIHGLLAPGSDDELLYAAGADNYRCPPRDLRVSCGGTGESYNYTETDPIGIQVNEIRAVTVPPVG